MPVSAYVKAGLFVVAAAAALFAAAGTVAIPGFWAYLAIFAVVMIVSFAALDPGLLGERMRPGGKKPPLSLRVFSLVLFMHWIVAGLDRGRFHWSDNVPNWLQGVCLFTVAAGYALALWAMRVNRQHLEGDQSAPVGAGGIQKYPFDCSSLRSEQLTLTSFGSRALICLS
jgi:hypothetical protein